MCLAKFHGMGQQQATGNCVRWSSIRHCCRSADEDDLCVKSASSGRHCRNRLGFAMLISAHISITPVAREGRRTPPPLPRRCRGGLGAGSAATSGGRGSGPPRSTCPPARTVRPGRPGPRLPPPAPARLRGPGPSRLAMGSHGPRLGAAWAGCAPPSCDSVELGAGPTPGRVAASVDAPARRRGSRAARLFQRSRKAIFGLTGSRPAATCMLGTPVGWLPSAPVPAPRRDRPRRPRPPCLASYFRPLFPLLPPIRVGEPRVRVCKNANQL